MRNLFISLIILLFYSCDKKVLKEEKNFYCAFDNNKEYLLETGSKIYEEIDFNSFKVIYSISQDTIFESRYLKIEFPEDLKSFSLKDSSICKFTLTEYDVNNNRRERKLNSGIINCSAINNDLWDLEIKFDDIHYRGIISKRNEKSSFLKW